MLFATRRLAATTLTFVVLTASPILAQSPSGRIVGRVVDASTGAPIPGAQVTIEGTSITAIADWSGRYGLYDVPAGSSVISVRMIGYQHKTVRDVVVQSGAGLALDLTLTASAIQIAAIEVSATEERGSAARALDEQRTSNQIINAVSGEQIRKSPDSDAGQAVQRVSGVSVQDGRYVFVRGLGERYTTTALNGARIPSPEPERKVVPLDLFPSGLLDGIVTAKTFTPDQPGDFSGAQVDLRTRDFLLQRVVSFSMSGGMNDAVTGTLLPFAPTEGSEWLGLAGDARSMPSLLASNPSLSGMDQTQINGVINTFRNVWSSRLQKGGRKGSFAASIGGSDPVFGRPLDYLASLTYSNETEARVDERRASSGAASSTSPHPLGALGGSGSRTPTRTAVRTKPLAWPASTTSSTKTSISPGSPLSNGLSDHTSSAATTWSGAKMVWTGKRARRACAATSQIVRISYIRRPSTRPRVRRAHTRGSARPDRPFGRSTI
jgi:hypothetical protein